MSDELRNRMIDSVVESEQVAPGQLRKINDWYTLTYLKTVKVKNYDPVLDNMRDQDVDSIQAVAFHIQQSGRLFVRGTKSQIKEIIAYLEAMSLTCSSNNDIAENHFSVQQPEVDLGNILKAFEDKGTISNVNKIRIKPLEVSLGQINNCIVNTNDYGTVRKMLEEDGDNIFGMELSVKEPNSTTVYFDIDSQIRVTSKDEDIDIKEFILDCSKYI